MAKTSSEQPTAPNPTHGPVPSFDAIRTDNDERSELRRNQTVPMPPGLRNALATQALPSLPADHLRATEDNMQEVLKPLLVERSRGHRLARRAAWLVVAMLLGGMGFVLLRLVGGTP